MFRLRQVLASLTVIVSALLSGNAAEIKITVGPDGETQSLNDAINKARYTRQSNDTVRILLSGTQYLGSPIYLGPSDSGITFEGAGKGAVLSGGFVVTGWKRAAGAIWQTEIPRVRSGALYFRQMFVNGQRRQRARTPNFGYFRIDGPWVPANPTKFKFHSGDIKKAWAETGDVEAVGYINWEDFHMPLQSVDESTSTVTLIGDSKTGGREDNARYFIENAPDGLDAPGEWQLDRNTGLLRYWPMQGEDMTKAEVIVPSLSIFISASGDPGQKKPVQNIVFRNLTFSYNEYSLGNSGYIDPQAELAIPGAVTFMWAKNCAFEDCKFVHLGTYGIQLGRGVQFTKIRYCEFFDLGAGGVRIGEQAIRSDRFDLSHSNEVSDCHVHHIGQFFTAGTGILLMQSATNLISHNHVHDTYSTAIASGWTWGYNPSASRKNVIEYNHLHDLGQGVLSDLGGVYILGPQPGTVVQNNLIHDVTDDRYGSSGLYADEGCSDVLMQNNVVYRVKTMPFNENFGRNVIVRNNIFAFGQQSQFNRTHEDNMFALTFVNNIVYFDSGVLQIGNWYNNKFKFDRNLYFDARPGAKIHFEGKSLQQWQAKGQDLNSMIADPRFVDPKNGDFRLLPDSPALKLGFKPIDVSTVGPRPRGVAALPGVK